MHSIETKQSLLTRMRHDLSIQTVRVQALEAEIEHDLTGVGSGDLKLVWRRAYGTELSYQGMSDLFLSASVATCETAARQLYILASPTDPHYAFWALRWWVCFSQNERRALVCDIVTSSEPLARVYAGKLLLFDYLWERTLHHLHPAIERVWLVRFVRNDSDTIEWLRLMEPWITTKLSASERIALQPS